MVDGDNNMLDDTVTKTTTMQGRALCPSAGNVGASANHEASGHAGC